jgi:uncharacterized membrane protein required for colicin V production
MSIELIVFLVALLPVVLRALLGWRSGATLELRHTLVYLFSMLAALRYWKPATEFALGMVSLDPQVVSTIVFLVIYLVAALFSGLIVNLKGEFFQSVAPNKLDNALGAVSGLLSGALLGGVVLMLCAFLMPGKVENFDASKFPARLDQFPAWVFQTVETNVGQVALNSTARTQFPVPPAVEPPAKPVPTEAPKKS